MMQTSATSDRVSLYSLLIPVARGWRWLVGVGVAAAVVTVGVIMIFPRQYRAPMSLSTILNPRASALGAGGLSALLANGASPGGLQATPALIVLLAGQNGVLDRVAHKPYGNGLVLDRLRQVDRKNFPERDAAAHLGHHVAVGADRQTGVISLEVDASDSAFARVVATELVAEISRTFIASSRAQASEIRGAMNARVDSAARQLRTAEEDYRAFNSGNRAVPETSPLWLDKQRISRAFDLAQTVYNQAVTDRESAVARELEATPAVVVVDSLPRELLPVPRHVGVLTVLAFFTGAVLMAFVLLLRAGVQQAERLSPQPMRELADAIQSIPFGGRTIRRAVGLSEPGVKPPSDWSGLRDVTEPRAAADR